MKDFLKTLDFKLLKKQKLSLLETIKDCDNVKRAIDLNGIVNVIDKIQDKAVDEFGYSEEEVFNLGKEN